MKPKTLAIAAILIAAAATTGYLLTRDSAPTDSRLPDIPQIDADKLYQDAIQALFDEDVDKVKSAVKTLKGIPTHTAHAYLLQGRLLLYTKQYQIAAGSFDQAAKNSELKAEALTYMGITAKNMNSTGTAIQAWTVALESNEDYTPAHRHLASLYYDLGMLQGAHQHLLRVGELDQADPRPYKLLGLINKDFDRNEDAVKYYLEAFKRDPEHPGFESTAQELAEVQIRLRQFKQALASLTKAIDSPEVDAMKAKCFRGLNRSKDMDAAVKKALTRDPKNLTAQQLKGTIELERSQLDQAKATFEKAIEDHPFEEQPIFKLSQVYAQMNKQEKAEEELARYKALREKKMNYVNKSLAAQRPENLGNPEILFELGELALTIGKPEAAKGWFNSTLRTNPQHPRAQQELQKLMSDEQPKK